MAVRDLIAIMLRDENMIYAKIDGTSRVLPCDIFDFLGEGHRVEFAMVIVVGLLSACITWHPCML